MVLGASCLPGLAADVPQTARPPSRIVILHGSDGRSPGQVQGSAAFRQAVAESHGTNVEVFNEDLDLTRFPNARVEELQVELLRLKFAAQPPRIVVAFGPVALDFAERHHDSLWPAAALIFMGIERQSLAATRHRHAVGGAVMHFAAASTLELGLALRPQTKRVVVVAGASSLDRMYLDAARTELERFAGRVPIEYLTDLPLEEMMARLRSLPRDSLIMPATIFRDSAGQSFSTSDVVASIGALDVAPVLALAENYIGRNTLGGHPFRFGDQGRQAGELASAILAGRDPQSIAVRRQDNGCVVDWRELRRWSISISRVPADCEVRYREYTIWEQHWKTALVIAAIIIFQAFLISVLVLLNRQRRRAEQEALSQHSQLAHAARLATVGELTASIAHEINQPLGAILSNADAAEILLESPEPDLHEVRQILADIRRDDERASAVIQRLRDLLARHEIDRQRLDPNTIVHEAVALISQEADRRDARLVESLGATVPAVQGDRIHLVQVMIILLINALDAMDAMVPARRRIVVSTGVAGAMVEITVRDAGPGIPAADFTRLFDSFFTTKAKGMGLGLSIARSIVEAHGGMIWAENLAGGGAVFRFRLAVAP
jgi:signal transduction histidine kinase